MNSGGLRVTIRAQGFDQAESQQGVVKLPFGSEYAIHLANDTDQDALAEVKIDGQKVSGGGFVVRAHSGWTVERPLDGPFKFKLVAADSLEAAATGKAHQPDDRNGVVEVKWRKLKKQPEIRMVPVPQPYPVYPRPMWPYYSPYIKPYSPWYSEPVIWSNGDSWGPNGAFGIQCNNAIGMNGGRGRGQSAGPVPCSAPLQTRQPFAGAEACTVSGSASSQEFVDAFLGVLEPEHLAVQMRLVLKGFFDEPQLANDPPRFCGRCGHPGGEQDNFCTRCGVRFPQ
jgi:hypothetical protein